MPPAVPPLDDPLEPYRALLRTGRNDAAAAALLDHMRCQPADAGAMLLLFDAYFQGRRWDDSLSVIGALRAAAPGHPGYRRLQLNALNNAGRHAEAAALAHAYIQDHGPDREVLNVLKVCCWFLGDPGGAIRFGQQALAEADRAAAAAVPAPTGPEAPGDTPLTAGANIIAFSLWGDDDIYTYGAMINLALAGYLYEGWVCRFYVGPGVPGAALRHLEAAGAQIVASAAGMPGYFSRFLVADDPGVGRFLCRDCDSRLGPAEVVAVHEWLDHGARFHVMRDHPLHNDPILAGLWGGQARSGIDMAAEIERYFDGRPTNKYGHDQRFLAERIWPRIRNRALVHDSCYTLPGVETRPFPKLGAAHAGAGHQSPAHVRAEAERLRLPRL